MMGEFMMDELLVEKGLNHQSSFVLSGPPIFARGGRGYGIGQ